MWWKEDASLPLGPNLWIEVKIGNHIYESWSGTKPQGLIRSGLVMNRGSDGCHWRYTKISPSYCHLNITASFISDIHLIFTTRGHFSPLATI